MNGIEAFDSCDGLGLAELVRRRELEPGELVEEAIRRIERVNPQLNAVIHTMYDCARQAVAAGLPDGPFRGVPFLIKDMMTDYAGAPSTLCSRSMVGTIAGHDSEIVRRHKAAGLVIVGKTNAPEHGLMPVTEPALFGPTRSPWNLERTPGGSSGGSAAAVAARLVPFAHGNDGAGSIRIPASCCGVFGLKPTRGRTPLGPDIAEAWQGLALHHVLTRSVRDSAAMLDATAGPDTGAPYSAPPAARPFLAEVGADPGRLRIAFSAEPFLPAQVHPDCAAGVLDAARLCEELGHHVEEATPRIDGPAFVKAFTVMCSAETRATVKWTEQATGCPAAAAQYELSTWALAMLGEQFTAGDYASALALLKGAGRVVGEFFKTYDVLLTPVLARPPVELGAFALKPRDRSMGQVLAWLKAGKLVRALGVVEVAAAEMFAFMPYTPLFNATGQPAMSVPLVWNDEGLPIGMHFAARFGDEATLFRLAAQLEQARPWRDRLPPVHG